MVTVIPRTLHLFWDGPPMPPTYRRFVHRWMELHPDWAFRLWDHEGFTREFAGRPTFAFYTDPDYWSPASNPWQWRANLARYEILNRHGGVWVDCDLEPLRPIDPLLEQADAAGGAFIARESAQFINNAFIGAQPGHPLLAAILGGLGTSVRNQTHKRSNASTGAQYLTRLLARRPDLQAKTLILPPEAAYPYHWRNITRYGPGETWPDAWVAHHWGNMRRVKQVPL